jgi:hypothetical protein
MSVIFPVSSRQLSVYSVGPCLAAATFNDPLLDFFITSRWLINLTFNRANQVLEMLLPVDVLSTVLYNQFICV